MTKRRGLYIAIALVVMAILCVIGYQANKTATANATATTTTIVETTLWNPDAASMAALKDYVNDVTNPESANFIPVEDRIVTFDLDGTLFCEKDPTYCIWQMFAKRVLHDDSYTAPADIKAVAEQIEQITPDSAIPDNLELDEAIAEAEAFAGMTIKEYKDYELNFLQEDATGFKNMKLADSFYQPMLQLIEYLQANDFTVYICSGTDRFWVRNAIEGKIDIPKEHVIGMDTTMVASGQGDTDGLDYVYTSDDEMIRGDTLLIKNVKMNKVFQITQEIGRQPVLAFGNSSGDASMLNFVLDDNPYKSMAFLVLADDTEREYGNTEKAAKMQAMCDENGWTSISMKNDWTTIYGENVTKG